ncbi:MAG: lipid A biosynthesis acyltransferase [Alphaproteobacteria bacterium]|nr:lipid A biosynthesis acyltransferase [Alphaproteobacteria bacterium]
MKSVRYVIEGIALHILMFLFSVLPLKHASDLGGWLGSTIGPRLAVNRRARRHVKIAFPNIDQARENEIIVGMWNNLGRVIAEYPHLQRLSSHEFTEIKNRDLFQSYLTSDTPVIFIGGHIANWEINASASYTQIKSPILLTYRAPNNPWAEKLLHRYRTFKGRLTAFPKSAESGRLIMKALQQKQSLGILIDQKYNEGLESVFFDKPAMTNPVFVQLAQRYQCQLVPVRNERFDRYHFRLTPYPPIPVFDEKGMPRAVEDVIAEANGLLENWIKKKPEQWIWLHRRWKSV